MNLTEMKEACAKATPGPWIRSGCRRKIGEEDCIMVGPDSFTIAALPIGRRPNEHAGAFNDAAFIAMSRSAVPELIARLEKAEALLRQAIDPHSDPMSDVAAIVAHLDPDTATGTILRTPLHGPAPPTGNRSPPLPKRPVPKERVSHD